MYISEAHGTDEWPITSCRYTVDGIPVCVKQSRDLENRTKVAEKFMIDYGMDKFKLLLSPPIELDPDSCNMNFETVYKPWPFRMFGFEKHVLTYVSEPRACETNIEELRIWIDNL